MGDDVAADEEEQTIMFGDQPEAERREPEPEVDDEEVEPPKESKESPGEEAGKRANELLTQTRIPQARPGGAPRWVRLPQGMMFPKNRPAVFVRFPSSWTDAPSVGAPLRVDDKEALAIAEAGALWRQVICWPISLGDKKFAVGRSLGDPQRAMDEMSKQMIRSIDGNEVDWTGKPGDGNVDVFWEQCGEKMRMILNRVFLQMHTLSRTELASFFESCIAVRTAG